MSLARLLFREFQPVFRMFEEPLSRSPSFIGRPSHPLFDDPLFRSGFTKPAVDVSEEGNTYVIEADLPGVKKENVEVRIGDGGRSLTIEGHARRVVEKPASTPDVAPSTETTATDNVSVPTADASKQLTTERAFSSESSFTRTVWLPRPVDTANVAAKLSDGILTVRVQKAEDKASVSIPIA
ncbi:hypothetical protein ONZ45_g4446 [Pleurotus djamor]|nr:hypothetical protein ONZ45_g4446 [Pleurotus djamor]